MNTTIYISHDENKNNYTLSIKSDDGQYTFDCPINKTAITPNFMFILRNIGIDKKMKRCGIGLYRNKLAKISVGVEFTKVDTNFFIHDNGGLCISFYYPHDEYRSHFIKEFSKFIE